MAEQIKPLNLMSIEELTKIITTEKENYNSDFHEKVVAEIESRGVKLSEMIDKALVRKNHEDEKTISLSDLLVFVNEELLPFDVLYITNFMKETLVLQNANEYWVIHHYSEKEPFRTGFYGSSNSINSIVEAFMMLKEWSASIEFNDHWETLIESNSNKYILKASELLNNNSIKHILNSRNLIKYINQHAAFSIIVLSEQIDESESVLDKFDEIKDELYSLLEKAESDNDPDEQLRILTELEAVTPDDPALFYNKAQLLSEKGMVKEASDALIDSFNIELEAGNVEDLEETENYLKECLPKVEEKENILHCLASIASFRGEVEEAFNYYKEIVKVSPEDTVAHLNLGHLYFSHTEEDDKVKFHFEKYLSLEPDSTDRESIESILENL